MTTDPSARHAVDLPAPSITSTPRGPRRGAEAADAKRRARAEVLVELAAVEHQLRAALPAVGALGAVADGAKGRTRGKRQLHTARRAARVLWARLLAKHGDLTREAARLRTCDARTRSGHPCNAPGRGRGGRCRRHGGASTGARSEEGRARAVAQLRAHRPAGPNGPRPRSAPGGIVARFRAAIDALTARRAPRRKPRTSTFTAGG